MMATHKIHPEKNHNQTLAITQITDSTHINKLDLLTDWTDTTFVMGK